MSNLPDVPADPEEGRDLEWEEFVQVMLVLEDLYEKDYSELTLRKWYDSMAGDMSAELFKVTANVWIENRKWMPKIPEFKRLARKITAAQAKMDGKRLAEARAEAEKARLTQEARDMYPEALREGRSIARAIQSGDFDVDAALGNALPADVEESYRNAADTSTEE